MPRHPAFTGSRVDVVGHAVMMPAPPVTRNWAWHPERYRLTMGGWTTPDSGAVADYRITYLLTLRRDG